MPKLLIYIHVLSLAEGRRAVWMGALCDVSVMLNNVQLREAAR